MNKKINGNNNKQRKKDLVKLMILEQYAGIYVDLNVVLT
jgi:hypothetical protein